MIKFSQILCGSIAAVIISLLVFAILINVRIAIEQSKDQKGNKIK